MHPYLEALQTRYDTLRASIEGLQTRAVEENRDLSADELRSITEMSEQGQQLHAQIESLAAVETRSASVAQLAADVAAATTREDGDQTRSGGPGNTGGGAGGDDQTRSTRLGTSGTQTRDRDPGHYLRSGRNSFFGDLYRSRVFGDEVAGRRLLEHTRALDTGTEGVGTVAPKWLTEEFEILARQGRALANAVRNIPLGDDPRPMTLPKQTAGTDAVVADQTNENDPVGSADAWDSDVDLVAPKPTAGKQVVSRQMVDMSSPAIDQLIYGDLMSVYNLKVENKVGAAVRAIGSALTATFAQFADMSVDETNGHDLAVNAGIAVRTARKLPAQILAMEVNTWGRYKKLKDSTGRPLIPSETSGPMNVIGVGSVAVDGQIENMGIIATDGMDDGVANQETFAAIRPSDVLLFETNMLRFRFEEQAGPESIVLGIWGYTAVIVRQGTKAVKRVQLTLV